MNPPRFPTWRALLVAAVTLVAGVWVAAEWMPCDPAIDCEAQP